MTDINFVDIIVLLIPIIAILLSGLSGGYLAVKKFILDLADALKDDVITKDELVRLIHDSLSIVNVFKHLFGK